METKSISSLDPMTYEGLEREAKIPVSAGPGSPKSITIGTLIDKAAEELAEVTQEQVTIEIVSTASLATEKITVYLNGDTLEGTQYDIAQDGFTFFTVPVNQSYRVVFPDITGYISPKDLEGVASVSQKTYRVKYHDLENPIDDEVLTIHAYSWTGHSMSNLPEVPVRVTMDGVTSEYTTDTSGNLSLQVPHGTQYTVAYDKTYDGRFVKGATSTAYTSEKTQRRLYINYITFLTGLSVINTQGQEFPASDWNTECGEPVMFKISNSTLISNDNVFGILISDITTASMPSTTWSATAVQFNSFGNGTSYYGYLRTCLLINESNIRGISVNAARTCYNKSVRIQDKVYPGFLPAVNQYSTVVSYENQIDNFIHEFVNPDMPTAWTTRIRGANKWTIDQYSAPYSYSFQGASSTYGSKNLSHSVFPFFAF
jgi:hypothetical protein